MEEGEKLLSPRFRYDSSGERLYPSAVRAHLVWFSSQALSFLSCLPSASLGLSLEHKDRP